MITRWSFTRVIIQSSSLAILPANGRLQFGLEIVKENLISEVICLFNQLDNPLDQLRTSLNKETHACLKPSLYSPLLHIIFQSKSRRVAHRTKPFLVKSTFKCSHGALLLMELVHSGTLLGALIQVNLSLVVGEQEWTFVNTIWQTCTPAHFKEWYTINLNSKEGSCWLNCIMCSDMCKFSPGRHSGNEPHEQVNASGEDSYRTHWVFQIRYSCACQDQY